MFNIACGLFGMALLAYISALCMMGTVPAEILSDVGNAIMLGTAVLLLLGLTKRHMEQEQSAESPREPA